MPWASSSVRGGRNEVAYRHMYLYIGKAILEKSEWQLFQKTWTFLVGGGSLKQSHPLHMG